MARRGSGPGTAVFILGLVLSGCLLPYTISSVYSVASTLLQVPTATRWLWGDWLSTVVEVNNPLYRLLVEAPVCCVGAVGLLLVVLGATMWISGWAPQDEYEVEEEPEIEPEP